MLQVLAPWPPVATNVAEYGIPFVPVGRDVVVIVNWVMVMLNALVPDAFKVSVAFTVKPNVPVFVGVPEITPPEERVRPFGNEPPVSDQVYGPVPPLAASVWL